MSRAPRCSVPPGAMAGGPGCGRELALHPCYCGSSASISFLSALLTLGGQAPVPTPAVYSVFPFRVGNERQGLSQPVPKRRGSDFCFESLRVVRTDMFLVTRASGQKMARLTSAKEAPLSSEAFCCDSGKLRTQDSVNDAP